MREANVDSGRILERPVSKADYAVDLLREASEGERAGLAKYGAFDPDKDKRILSREAIEEQRDAYVYMRFLKRKHPMLMVKATEAQRKILAAYIALRELETEERGLCATPSDVASA